QRFYLDRQGDQVTECALAELIEDGELARHTRRTRRIYQARRDHCAALLAQQLGSAVRFQRPNGGMALWARIDRSIGGERLAECAEREGVLIQAGRQFRLDRSETPFIRLGYAALDDVELVEAVRRLKRAFHEARR
ncbi:MAG TPA: aminotransferase class I/II-fold pyridoxal phosphate-dependent enzyme, partial [Polyangiales bacterium]